jgi:hypothetical protein
MKLNKDLLTKKINTIKKIQYKKKKRVIENLSTLKVTF